MATTRRARTLCQTRPSCENTSSHTQHFLLNTSFFPSSLLHSAFPSLSFVSLSHPYPSLPLSLSPPYLISYFQLHGDLDTLTAALGGGSDTHHPTPGADSCSALVQVLPGNSDLLVGHNTWTSYYNMIRIFKLYDLKLHLSPSNRMLHVHVCTCNW